MQTINDDRYSVLACAQSLRYASGKIAGTANAAGLRAQLDEEMRARWESDPRERREKHYKIMTDAGPLATYSINTTGGTAMEQTCVTDMDALLDWLRGPDGGEALATLASTAPDLIRAAARSTGQNPPGIDERVVTPPETYLGTTLQCTETSLRRAAILNPELHDALNWLQSQNTPRYTC